MKLPWFTSSATAAPTRSGTGLTSTYATDRAEALATHRKAAEDDLEKQTRAINAQLAAAKKQAAQRIADAEAAAEAARVRVGQEVIAEFYSTAEPLARTYMSEPTRESALGIRSAYVRLCERTELQLGATQHSEVVGLALASVLVADVPASVTAFADFNADILGMSTRAVADPLLWCEELAQLERRLVATAADFASRGYPATDYHQSWFQAAKSAPTPRDRILALEAVQREEDSRQQEEFQRTYVPPPQGEPVPQRTRGMFGAP